MKHRRSCKVDVPTAIVWTLVITIGVAAWVIAVILTVAVWF